MPILAKFCEVLEIYVLVTIDVCVMGHFFAEPMFSEQFEIFRVDHAIIAAICSITSQYAGKAGLCSAAVGAHVDLFAVGPEFSGPIKQS